MPDKLILLLILSMFGIFTAIVFFLIILSGNKNKLLRQNIRLKELEAVHQQELLKTIIMSQEKERKRIGQDLHDGVGTALSNLRLNIDYMESGQVEKNHSAAQAKLLIDRIIQDVRRISHNLSPVGIELYGFAGALEELCESISITRSLQITLINKVGSFNKLLYENTSISLYRVLEELLNNTIKHANATLIDICIDHLGNCIEVTYRDNGRGMADSAKVAAGMGMSNIDSRLTIVGATYTMNEPGISGFNMNILINKI